MLVPFSDAFEVVTRATYAGGPDAEAINRLLGCLNQLGNTDWIPPAISYFSRPTAGSASLLRFLTDLERLAGSMLIRRVDITRRVERSPAEQGETLGKLDAEIYTVLRVRSYVLQRLNSALSDGGAGYDHYPMISVEHVLPQNPADGSEWTTAFTARERAYWVHRLANLVLLSKRKNSAAGNLGFTAKKTKYFEPTSWPPFVLTSQVLASDVWTPAVLEERQELLLKVLGALWRLEPAAS
ncbi:MULTISPECIES: HNH endonuclease family protein [unclassified Amycolatopsis]|uniref:HNH endonuclease family protein n=1 Tax=unclassified Amycolatopsis TaxID=2618356 RepID=UPI002874B897|nr:MULTISPECIES: HNH endonuclease family protein [unclassified Amycolatopsis]MDS0137966.1 HNH endonuclease [Amycolatopsis sp. 505]MDS0144121.1 HNH endonuclease [Amycolatopsis sp. CM201R]